MTHVVTGACQDCKYTDCVVVCPVDCFKEGPNFLIIDPDECIDCGVCIPECPVDAIVQDDDTRVEGWLDFANQHLDWPIITQRKEPLAKK
jgi:ferredoxin